MAGRGSDMHFTLRQLQAFLAVASTGSFTQAAEYLSLSPSAVSQLIIELESLLDYKLFDRSTRKVALSAAGRTFLPSVRDLLRQMDTTRMVATDIRDQAAGLVRVAAPLVIASTMLPRLLAGFKRRHPKSVVRPLDCAVEDLVEKVASRQADLSLGPDRPVGPEVRRIALFPSPWVVWCAPSHRLARMKRIRWSDLARFELVTAGRDHEIHLASMRQQMPENSRVMPQHVVDNISTALGLAAAGLCFTLSPAYVESLARPLGLVRRDIDDPTPMREMSLYLPADRHLSPAATAFAAYLQKNLDVAHAASAG
ncbi:MAG: LysR family transcriptional regulator [Pseudacidovorax sp.]|nr:LysR family transcriptional regulator [Pseudacidovorax sp.]